MLLYMEGCPMLRAMHLSIEAGSIPARNFLLGVREHDSKQNSTSLSKATRMGASCCLGTHLIQPRAGREASPVRC